MFKTERRMLFATTLLLGFVGLAIVAHSARHGTALDHAVLDWMIDHRRGWLTTVAIVITNAGSPVAVGLLAAAAAALLWWRRSSPTSAVVVVATLAVATGVSTVTKVIVGAQRPTGAVQLLREVDPSFPSGHVTGTLALVGIVAVVVGRGRRLIIRIASASAVAVATAAVALTRLYLGVHWLTDIGGGLLLGGAAVLVGAVAHDTVRRAGSESGRQSDAPTPPVARVA
ncbi:MULTISPECIES: phosphatase PAP2 family protein [unclassified Mycobacterium]|uniref:phosphatase PAP2 family protein n=1 Tax=unclassified Mycobacterium TaxID=2642494 RepID=UPI0029C99555|nr:MULTISPECIES: phosphatase PAP2 family protein [unclassified Mycobacterium]